MFRLTKVLVLQHPYFDHLNEIENIDKLLLGQLRYGIKISGKSTRKLNLSFSYSEFCSGGPQKLRFWEI